MTKGRWASGRVATVGSVVALAAVAMGGWAEPVRSAAPPQAAAKPANAPAAKPGSRRPIQDFATLPTLQGPALSPDGKAFAGRIAINGTLYLAIVPLEGGKPRIVGLGDADLNWWRWVNDDWLVIGVGKTDQVEGNEWYISRAVSVSADASKVQVLARDAAQSGDNLLWAANDGTPRILLGYQTSIYSNLPGFWPRVDLFDLSTGRRTRVMDGQNGVMRWFADGKGAVRMGIGRSEDGRKTRLLYRPGDRGRFRTVDRNDDGDMTVPALFLDDPAKALTITDDENGFSALYDFDLTTMTRGKQIAASKGFDLAGLISDADESRLLGVEVQGDRPEQQWLDPELTALAKTLSARVQGGSTRLVSFSRDRSRAILFVGGADAPGAYYLYDKATDSFAELGSINTSIGMKRLHPVRTLRYKARDGLEIAAVLTLPRGAARDLPLIVLPHGGPFARDIEEWDWWTQFLADRGYAVVQPNYRGSSGYGTPFSEKGEGQWGLAMQDDLNDAVAELAKQGIADPKRVCMVGASYGGYAALRAAERDPKLFRCAVSFAGVSDLNAMRRYDGRFLFSGVRSDWLKKQAPDLAAVSPLNDPEGFGIPVLLVHGVKDRVVPVKQSRMMAQRLQRAGKPVDYLEQPLADHHFSREQDRLEFLQALETFLAKHNPA
ncbi:alpha/beta hydrolase family protein [Sphingomonas sp. ac-8]|uniref:alpha/beta hydrolase family protein n=1 Tax=Sphingomonas sp. ac-8 TaxID=3242977 RepID=UPI003A7F96C2